MKAYRMMESNRVRPSLLHLVQQSKSCIRTPTLTHSQDSQQAGDQDSFATIKARQARFRLDQLSVHSIRGSEKRCDVCDRIFPKAT